MHKCSSHIQTWVNIKMRYLTMEEFWRKERNIRDCIITVNYNYNKDEFWDCTRMKCWRRHRDIWRCIVNATCDLPMASIPRISSGGHEKLPKAAFFANVPSPQHFCEENLFRGGTIRKSTSRAFRKCGSF